MNQNIWGIVLVVVLLLVIAGTCLYGLLNLMQARLPDDEKEDSLLSSFKSAWDDLLCSFTFTPHKRMRLVASVICFIAVTVPSGMFLSSRLSWDEALLFYWVAGMLMSAIISLESVYASPLELYETCVLVFIIIPITGALAPITLGMLWDATSSDHSMYPSSQ